MQAVSRFYEWNCCLHNDMIGRCLLLASFTYSSAIGPEGGNCALVVIENNGIFNALLSVCHVHHPDHEYPRPAAAPDMNIIFSEMRMPTRGLYFPQPSFLLRTIRLSSLALFINQQRRPISGNSKPVSSITRSIKNSDVKPSPDTLEAAEFLKDFREKWALSHPEFSTTKEYDDIEHSLNGSHIQPGTPWGFVVIRTAYGAASDAPWARMLECLRSYVADTLVLGDQTDLIPRHELTVIEDEALAGADSHTVRNVFRAWVTEDLTLRLCDTEKYGGSAQVRAKLASTDAHFPDHPVACLPPRWIFCLFVDEDCLRSLENPSSECVKILTTNWVGEEGEDGEDMDPITVTWDHEWDGGETNSDQEDVGWMYMDVTSYVPYYSHLTNSFFWDTIYSRPYKRYIA
jgi:hypothetical protein